MMRNTLQNHIRQYGADGRFTWNAGLTVEEAAEPGMVEAVKRSTLHEFKLGDIVRIRGADYACEVSNVHGDFVNIRWHKMGYHFREWHDLPVRKKGSLHMGTVIIYKGHLEPLEWLS